MPIRLAQTESLSLHEKRWAYWLNETLTVVISDILSAKKAACCTLSLTAGSIDGQCTLADSEHSILWVVDLTSEDASTFLEVLYRGAGAIQDASSSTQYYIVWPTYIINDWIVISHPLPSW